ncbi:hypothetical protein GQR60_16270 [Labilibaculum sp. A4]|uniref:DUF4149 domain-containing protein n=1 Tax=Labilibaculum euxinus TaxID=2686357 RepID=A0A425Y5X5_9BACT|nr:hypothetical protein [Labilibaculum euxinus]MDQ1772194.1 hypothetical protein [Labilibaculum euxinus]MUP39320.1 hypothetical protein [Labilibaculum euxinus]MVB08525.1 hypothetical protein [Labilibaculum euxinus]MWN77896.1 hypothetical protein [Labilibaculum euxinus]
MTKIAKYGFVLSFVWVGFLLAISFMEAWVKFRAVSLDLPTGLDVGVHVFGALNMIERIFSAMLLVYVFINYTDKVVVLTGLTIFTFVVAQSGYLLPELNQHAQLIIMGMVPEKNSIHHIYVLMEVVKLVALLVLGFRQVRIFKQA